MFSILLPNLQGLSPWILVIKYSLIPLFLLLVYKTRTIPRDVLNLFLTFIVFVCIELLLVITNVINLSSILSAIIHWFIFLFSYWAGKAVKSQAKVFRILFLLHVSLLFLQYMVPTISSLINQLYGSVQDELSSGTYRRNSGIGSSFYASVLVALFLLLNSDWNFRNFRAQILVAFTIFFSLSRTSVVLLLSFFRFSFIWLLGITLLAILAYKFVHPLAVLMDKFILIATNLNVLVSEKNASISQRVSDYLSFIDWIRYSYGNASTRSYIEDGMEIGLFNAVLNGFILGIALYSILLFKIAKSSLKLAIALFVFELISIGLWRYDVLLSLVFG